MEMFLPAVLSDLLGRSVSFLVQRYWQQSSVEESIEQLHLALLRVAVTVEEAEGRRITNQAMLRQLDMLRDAMYGGHYMLDALAYGQSHVVADDPAPSPCRLSSALSRLNPTKRLCFAADSTAEVRRVVDRLGCMLADMKEFVVFLKGYPRVCRQPRSAHLLLEKLMFGRQKEMEQVISFLLRGAEFGGDGVGVLPVVGPARVGKSTLVEHVCHDDRVRSHFSSILLMSGDDLEDDKLLNDPGEHGLIKHQSRASHNKCSLVILELAEDEVPDEARWRRLRSSAFCKGIGSKIIVTSRSDTEAVQRLGTEHPLRLKVLRPEAYWHYFKTLAFGSTNPEEHPRLVAIAMDICREEKGSFIGANIACSLLRANLDARFWRSILDNMREYTEKHRHLFGKHPHDLLGKNRHVYLWRLARTSKVFVSYGCYQACPAAQEDVPRMMTLQEVLSGRPAPCGRFEALAWRSQIPPCYSYLMSCSVQTPVPPHVLARKKSSRLL